MAKGTQSCLFLAFLSLLIVCCHGTSVGFYYHAKGNFPTPVSIKGTVSFLKLSKAFSDQVRVFVEDHKVLNSLSDTGISFDLFLRDTEVAKFLNSQSSAISWMKTNLVSLPPHVKINRVVVSSSNVANDSEKILLALEVVDSVISSFHFRNSVNLSVEFPLSCLKALSRTQEKDVLRIFELIKKVKSSVIIKDDTDGRLIEQDEFGQFVVERATFVTSILPPNGVPVFLTFGSPVIHSARGLAEFVRTLSLSIENNTQIVSRIAGIYAEVPSIEDFAPKELKRKEEEIFQASRRQLMDSNHPKTTLHDVTNPPTVFPTPPGSSTPAIVTVPSTNPVTVTPTSPSTPMPIPSITPVPVPPAVPVTNPANTPPPAPIPGAQPNAPVTNPPPSPASPVSTPVTNPGVPGQSWCIAKSGVSQTALQAALDYACGIGGADCSQIQQGASCYSPESLENHASYAFNSYYQKHPGPTSCDFGGTATITNANPSTGSCVYPSSTSTTSSTPPSTPTTQPPTTVSPPTSATPPPVRVTPPPSTVSPPKSTTPSTTISPPTSPGSGLSGSGFPPMVWNSSNPNSGGTTGFGLDSPPTVTTTDSGSADLQPFFGCTILITSFVTGKIISRM